MTLPEFDELEGLNWISDLDNGHTVHFFPGLIVFEQPDRACADVYLDGARRPKENDLSRAFKRNAYGPAWTCSKVWVATLGPRLSWVPTPLPLHVAVHLPSGDVLKQKSADVAWSELRRRFMAMAFPNTYPGGSR